MQALVQGLWQVGEGGGNTRSKLCSQSDACRRTGTGAGTAASVPSWWQDGAEEAVLGWGVVKWKITTWFPQGWTAEWGSSHQLGLHDETCSGGKETKQKDQKTKKREDETAVSAGTAAGTWLTKKPQDLWRESAVGFLTGWWRRTGKCSHNVP